MKITITHKDQCREAVMYLEELEPNRVCELDSGALMFFKATPCDNCKVDANGGNSITIGCTTIEASKQLVDMVKVKSRLEGWKIKKAKNVPGDLGYNEKTNQCVCLDCDREIGHLEE